MNKKEIEKKTMELFKKYGIKEKFESFNTNKYHIGISLYPEKSKLSEIKDFIKLGHLNGINHIFTNMLFVENKNDQRLNLMKEPLAYARNLGYNIIIDLSPIAISILDIDPKSKQLYHFIKEYNATGVRFDMDYGGGVEAFVSKNLKVEINASTMDVTLANNFIKFGGNLENLTACHNFYPQRYTGLSEDFFRKTSLLFKNLGIKVSAFVALHSSRKSIGAWEINDGMPTLEKHRDKDLSYQIRWLFATNLIDQVIISAQYPTKEEMAEIGKIKKGAINLLINLYEGITELEKNILFNAIHLIRQEKGDHIAARCTFTRLLFKNESIPPRLVKRQYFKRGDVVILNNNYGRYKGEVQIISSNFIKNDGTRNLVGTLTEEEMELVKPKNLFGFRQICFLKI